MTIMLKLWPLFGVSGHGGETVWRWWTVVSTSIVRQYCHWHDCHSAGHVHLSGNSHSPSDLKTWR